jgi:hypothetical protein
MFAPRAMEEGMRSVRAIVLHLRRDRLGGLLEIGLEVFSRLAAHLIRQPWAIKQEVATPVAQITHGLFKRGSARGSP